MSNQFEFMTAVNSLDYASVRKMLEAGFSPYFHWLDAQETPLHDAIDSEIDWNDPNPDGKMVQLLLDFGADPNLLNSKGQSPLDWAQGHSTNRPVHPEACEMLLERGGRHNKPLYESIVTKRKWFW